MFIKEQGRYCSKIFIRLMLLIVFYAPPKFPKKIFWKENHLFYANIFSLYTATHAEKRALPAVKNTCL